MSIFKNLLIVFTISIITACGGSSNEEIVSKPVELKGYEELDLNQYGFQMGIMIPNAEENGEPNITLTERGALEITVGQSFGIEIMFGEGDIELLKMDLKEDLVFSSEIVKEDTNSLIYKQDIPDSGIKTQHHFFYKAVVGSNIYEVRDLIDGSYGSAMIENMLTAAKTLREIKPTAKVQA
ncbi:MAG: hypothetical protein IT232_02970 [Flavobacteriales bacterium]|nr:hypothetical protein [Flavobacteriales bacterium]